MPNGQMLISVAISNQIRVTSVSRKKKRGRFYCRYIQDPDQQRYCFAYLDRTPEQCNAIQDETLKAQCEAEAQVRLDEAVALQKAAEEKAKAKAEVEAAKASQEANKAPAQQGR